MKFSILTAVWNRVDTLGQALDSLATQCHGDYEHIVQDGGSTDGTLALLESYSDPRRALVSTRDGGIYDALNRALARSSGEVIGILHSDDFYSHSDVLAQVARCFRETGVDAVYGDLDYVSAADPSRTIRHWKAGPFNPGSLRYGWMPPHPALFLRREVIEAWGGYDTSYRISADYDAVLRYFDKGRISSIWLPEVLVKMRVGGESNRSLRHVFRKSAEDYRALKRSGVGGLDTLFMKNLRKLPQFF